MFAFLSGVGNIEFRNLVLTRKAEYLAAPSRDVKGRIANEVVDAVRNRGGRFVKKLNAKQLEEKGFKKDMNVYELADESTVLEKGKRVYIVIAVFIALYIFLCSHDMHIHIIYIAHILCIIPPLFNTLYSKQNKHYVKIEPTL